jgi:sortase A
MPQKEKTYKIQISRLLIVAFAFVLAVFLALVFAFSRATAPAPTPLPAATAPTSIPTESDYILKIGKINLSAPIIINVDGNDKVAYNKALESGVAHLMGSALPGKVGNSFIFGHSSYYAWKPGDYKEIFEGLNNVEVGDTIIISSNSSTYNYKVSEKQVVNSDDVAVADQNYNEKKLTLMTCWPIGSDAKRLVIVGLLQE